VPKILLALVSSDPGALDGKIDDLEVALPTGPLPGNLPSRPGLELLRERLSITAHRLTVEVVEGGRVLELELRPR
jgi:hypothetical protein